MELPSTVQQDNILQKMTDDNSIDDLVRSDNIEELNPDPNLLQRFYNNSKKIADGVRDFGYHTAVTYSITTGLWLVTPTTARSIYERSQEGPYLREPGTAPAAAGHNIGILASIATFVGAIILGGTVSPEIQIAGLSTWASVEVFSGAYELGRYYITREDPNISPNGT